jgi:hypothetical protein
MSTRAMGPGAGWRWLKQAINLGRHNPRAIFGAVALLALVALVPSVVQVALQYGASLPAESVLMIVGVMTLAMIFIYPLLIGGVLRVIHASETGSPTHATAMFDTFRAGSGAGRLVGFGVLLTLAYIAAFMAVILSFGQGFLAWYMEVITSGMQGGNPAQMAEMPEFPEGLGTVMALGTLVGLFFGGVYAIGFGQVALGGRGVGAALADGVAGAVKNLLPILVLAIIAIVMLLALGLVVLLLGALLVMIGSLVHEALAVILVIPLYLGMLLLMYVVMFGVMYYMWRDVCGEAAAPAERGDQLEV